MSNNDLVLDFEEITFLVGVTFGPSWLLRSVGSTKHQWYYDLGLVEDHIHRVILHLTGEDLDREDLSTRLRNYLLNLKDLRNREQLIHREVRKTLREKDEVIECL